MILQDQRRRSLHQFAGDSDHSNEHDNSTHDEYDDYIDEAHDCLENEKARNAKDDKEWESSYIKLGELVQRYGPRVSIKKIARVNHALKYWINHQREQFIMWKEGKLTSMTNERQEKLDLLYPKQWWYLDKWFRRYLHLEKYCCSNNKACNFYIYS
ncbi:hypothetical protein ACA910_010375 [Epithemia clementina (nom. ined.)]